MGAPKNAHATQAEVTSRSPAAAATAPPLYEQVNLPPPSYEQVNPHVQMNEPPGFGGGTVYPPTPQVFMDQGIGEPWTSGLFDCNRDETNAVVTAFFPCVTYGQTAEILDSGQTSCLTASVLYLLLAPAVCSCWILGFRHREKLRNQYNLVEAPAEDWVVHLFCPCCALCQEFRELKSKGIDPSLGYLGNVALAQRNVAMVAPKAQHMAM